MNSSRGAKQTVSPFDILGGIEQRSAADHALALLLDAIRSGFYQVGDALPKLQALSAGLGVSHVIARQAIEVLAECGVLEVRSGRTGGIFLVGVSGVPRALARIYSPPSPAELESLIEARRVLELAILRRACEVATDADHEELAELLGRFEQATSDAVFVELTVQFNIKLALIAGNPMLTRFLREVLNRMAIGGLKRRSVLAGRAVEAPASDMYRDMVRALEKRDDAAFEAIVDRHMELIGSIYGVDQPPRKAIRKARTTKTARRGG